jgi:hypothetical protein
VTDVFTPASLFAGGIAGAWYDPSDLSTLFQDSAGTTPVTTAGQPVGLMLDKSGNANHATQATAAARPTYQTDDVLHWLEFDGVDDTMAAASGVYFGEASTTVVAVTPQERAANNRTFSRGGVDADAYVSFGTDKFEGALNGYAAGTNFQVFTVASSGANVFAWLRSKPDNTATFRKNGSLLNTTTHSKENTADSGLMIAGDGTKRTRLLFFGVVHIERVMTSSEIDMVEAFLAEKSGVTL